MAFHQNYMVLKNWPRAALAVTLFFCLSYCQTKLIICVPGKQNTQRLQSGFDALIRPKKTAILGRIKDLDALMPENPNAAIISNRVLFNYIQGYTIALVGKKKMRDSEKYFIVTVSKEISMRPVSETKVGIVDFLIKDHLPGSLKTSSTVRLCFLRE